MVVTHPVVVCVGRSLQALAAIGAVLASTLIPTARVRKRTHMHMHIYIHTLLLSPANPHSSIRLAVTFHCSCVIFLWLFFPVCTCDPRTSLDSNCNAAGQCHCKPNYTGPRCESCALGYYSYPTCSRKSPTLSRMSVESQSVHSEFIKETG